jgi:predicted outer membrane repeat protein
VGAYAIATLSLSECVVAGNNAQRAGGLSHHSSGKLTIDNSTISGNTAIMAGGAYIGLSPSSPFAATITNTTFANNQAAMFGGAVQSQAPLTLNNCTVASNTAGWNGGGIDNTAGALTLNNSIVAGNSAPSDPNVFGSFTGSNNLTSGDPMLGPLADNGGPTLTMALLPGSPAIDAGSDALIPPGVTTDQRGAGYPRCCGNCVDIGAFELSADIVAPAVQSSQFLFLSAPQRLSYAFSENVQPSLGVQDLLLENLSTSSTIPSANIAFSYDTQTNTASFTFPGYQYGALPAGNYRAILLASGVTDPSGNPLPADHVETFFFFNGDADRDRDVDLDDFNILASHFGTSGNTFADGDFTYDATVDLDDFNVLASNFGLSLAQRRAPAVFAQTRIIQELDPSEFELLA